MQTYYSKDGKVFRRIALPSGSVGSFAVCHAADAVEDKNAAADLIAQALNWHLEAQQVAVLNQPNETSQ